MIAAATTRVNHLLSAGVDMLQCFGGCGVASHYWLLTTIWFVIAPSGGTKFVGFDERVIGSLQAAFIRDLTKLSTTPMRRAHAGTRDV